jgi:hypothetical protein
VNRISFLTAIVGVTFAINGHAVSARTLSPYGGVEAAPSITIGNNMSVAEGAAGQIDGNPSATWFSGPTQPDNFVFEGTLPGSTSEPLSMVLIGCGLLGLGLTSRRLTTK